MSLFRAGLQYFKSRRDVLRYHTRASLLARLQDDMNANAGKWTNEPHNPAVLRLPVLDYSQLSFAAIKCSNGLYAFRNPHGSYSFPLSVRDFARDYAHLAYRHAHHGLDELADIKLISKTVEPNYISHVRLCDPAGSGTPIDDMLQAVDQEFFEHDEAFWYAKLLGLRVTLPAPDEFTHTFKTNCPFCSRAPRNSKERGKFGVHVTSKPDSRGHSSSWTCHRCGRCGYCEDLFLQLYQRRKREEQISEHVAQKFVTGFPAQEVNNDNEIPF